MLAAILPTTKDFLQKTVMTDLKRRAGKEFRKDPAVRKAYLTYHTSQESGENSFKFERNDLLPDKRLDLTYETSLKGQTLNVESTIDLDTKEVDIVQVKQGNQVVLSQKGHVL